MAATKLGLYELLAPQFLAGFRFPEKVDRYLSVLDVDELHAASDESGVVYTGEVSFRDEVGAAAIREHVENNAVFRWEDVTIDFRLTIPRDGAQFIDDAASAIALGATADPKADDLEVLFNALGPVEQAAGTATEFPGIRFRLELLLTAITLHLPNKTDDPEDNPVWIPGKKGPDFRIIPDPDRAKEDVRFLLPKMVFEYEQGDDFDTAPTFRLKSWGSSGFDAPADLEEGEVVTMEPPIALRTDGRYAFSVENIVVDLSPDHTPPEILEFFGTDESFEGFFVKGARFFYSDKDKDFAFDFAIKDLLVSFAWEISFEASVDFLFERALTFGINVTPKFFDEKGEIKDYIRGKPADGQHSNILTNGAAKVPQTAILQMEITGGIPDYTISVKLDGAEIFDTTRREARISPGMPGTLHPVTTPGNPAILVISVTDSAKEPNVFSETIKVIIVEAPRQPAPDRLDGSPADRPPDQGDLPTAHFEPNAAELAALRQGFGISHDPDARRGTAETLVILSPPSVQPAVRVNGAQVPVNAGRASFDVPEGSDTNPLAIDVAFPQIAAPAAQTFPLLFDRNRPADSGNDVRRHIDDDPANQPVPLDVAFHDSGARAALRKFVTDNAFASVSLHAHASFQQDTRQSEDQSLSERRRDVARGIIESTPNPPTITEVLATGFDQRPSGAKDNPSDQVVIVTGTFPATPAQTVHATISRAKRPAPTPPPPGDVIVPPDREAPRPQTRRPPVWKRLSFRTRFERNEPVLGEVSGTIDFETESEEAIRRGMQDGGQSVSDTDKLGLKQTSAASADPHPQDGVVDFKLNVAYDTATGQLTETLSFGDTKDEVNGLLRMENPRASGSLVTSENRLKDIFGAVLVFAPIINNAASALDPGSAGDWAVLGLSLGVPVAIGALDIFQTTAITLFEGTGVFRQFVGNGNPIEFTDFGVVFDYRVEFNINFDIDLIDLHIHTTKPLKVRYKAVGFNVHLKDGSPFYQAIFDTSKGYEIDLSDPGLLDLPAPLGSVLKIAAARIARFNPLTLEADLAIKADLGVITVDRFKVKVPLDPPGIPTIMPSGVKVNIPATIIGSGYVNILEGGFEGALDVTLVPTKLRVAASIAVESIEDAATQRKAVAVFAGIVVEFPTPIVLGGSGLGIYGFSGLFAMHYKRDERPPSPGDSVSPALRWLERAGGEPQLLVRGADHLWVPEFDRWSFGVGAILGTVDGGFLINFRGMFVLELPGPRILILVKVQIVKDRPKLGDSDLTVGILGAIDLDFNLGQITIGVIVGIEIKELISVRLPVEIFYKIGDSRKWHLYIGTIAQPATALVLNARRAHGYFMLDGDKIDGFPGANGTVTLPGIAVATGIEVSLVLGDEDIGLFLRCAAEANLGVAFSPFFITGLIKLTGELRLFIVSIEATGKLTVEAPDPTIIHGEVCGKVSFFFFSVKGCVGLTIGSGTHALPAPPLIRNAYLQSHAPVIAAGQGTDRPIDATLGDAVLLNEPGGGVPAGAEIPVVPIDSVPVLQMHAAPRVTDGTNATTTFTEPLVFTPNLTPDGWINVGGGRQVRYFLKEIALDPPLPAGSPKPPATWRTDQAPTPQGVDTNVDLALFSRVPVTASRALERSTELNGQITDRWSGMCDPVAPPACVLWTFCRQPLGPSGEGWHLQGIPEPDPPGTHRHGAPPLDLFVEEPVPDPGDALLDLLLTDAGFAFNIPAKVLGINTTTTEPPPPAKRCVDFRRAIVGAGPNPRVVQGIRFLARNAAGQSTVKTQVVRLGKFVGLNCAISLEVTLPVAAAKVELLLVHNAVPAVIIATNEDGTPAARATMAAAKNKPQIITLEGAAIRKVIIRARQNATLLMRICFEPRAVEPQSFDCFRVLQLPQEQPRKTQNPIKLPPALEERARHRVNNQFIILHTGLAVRVRLFIALAKQFVSTALIQQLDAAGAVLAENKAGDFSPVTVSGISTGLPADWVAPAGPWDDEVIPAATFAADPRFNQLLRMFIEMKPHPRCTKIEILLPPGFSNLPVPAALLIAVEVCSKAEQDRAEEGQQIQTGQIETVSGYLNGGDLVPLLEPNRTYTLTARYDAESMAEDGTTSTESDLLQRFRFRTDAKEPARLDPFVLGTTPDHEERFHFYEDPLGLVFNDVAVVQLFAAYGKNLRTVLRAADGVPVAPDEITTLDPIVGEFSTPYRDLLAALIAAGLAPCVGEVSAPLHASYTSPVTLRPLMGYTFDVELVPPTTPPPGTPAVPLYRRSFATSRFASLAALIDDLKAGNIRHRALTAPLAELPDIATDQQIQDALLAAGEQALPAPATTGITIYWAVRPGTARFFPHMILLDAAEPLWRTRSEPRLETVPNQDDPAFERVVPQNVPAVEIIEQAGAAIARFVRSPSGTRTLAMVANTFTPPTAGATITLAARRTAGTLYGIAEQIVQIAAIKFTKAPWEEDGP